MRGQQKQTGSVRFDKRRGTWHFQFYEGSVRRSQRIGTKQEFPTKVAAWREANRLAAEREPADSVGETVSSIALRYEAERMPTRKSTARVYRSFLRHHVLPKWGDANVRQLQPRPVELWLRELPLSAKTKGHIRSLLYGLVDFAMWAGVLEVSRNPISLVHNAGASKRVRKPRSLTTIEFQAFAGVIEEPYERSRFYAYV